MQSVAPYTYLADINEWYDNLPAMTLADFRPSVAIVVTDMINGFTHEGPLASPRVAALVPGIVRLCEEAHKRGTRLFMSLQDTHRQDSIEFQSYPPHAIRGTKESELIPELQDLFLPWKVFEKDTLTASHTLGYHNANPGFLATLLGAVEKRNPGSNTVKEPCNVQTFVVVGNCTDLCVYQCAMDIKQWFANVHKDVAVVVAANLTDTYDAPFHPGDFYHKLFLKHMEMNGIRVVNIG